MKPFRFGVNVWGAGSRTEWVSKARRVEELGYSTLTGPDHLGEFFSPMPALISAAEATTRRTQADVPGWTAARLDERIRLVREAAGVRYELLEVSALVQRVVVTGQRRQAAEELGRRWTQLSAADILEAPDVLVGTVDQLVEDLQARRERWASRTT